MSKIKPALVLYFIASFLFVISTILESENLALVVKPLIFPAISFYYLTEVHGKNNSSYFAIMVLFFFADIIELLGIENRFYILVITYFLTYVIYLNEVIHKSVLLKPLTIVRFTLVILIICSLLFFYLMFTLLDLLIDSYPDYIYVLFAYGVIITLIAVLSVMNFLIKANKLTFFMLLISICFSVSDVFYILRKVNIEFEVFNFIHNLAHILSYYYITKYFILKSITRNV